MDSGGPSILTTIGVDPGGGGGRVLTAIGVDSGGPSILTAIGVDPGPPEYSRLYGWIQGAPVLTAIGGSRGAQYSWL